MRECPGNFDIAEPRNVSPVLGFPDGVRRDRILPLPLDGVPSIVVSGLRYVLVEARKLGVPSSGPELELGLLFDREDGLKEVGPPALEPGRLDPPSRDDGRDGSLFFADSVSKNKDPLLLRAGDDGNCESVSIARSDRDNLPFSGRRLTALVPHSSSVVGTD